MPTLEFFGLCALMETDGTFQASMPKVEKHRTVLFLDAKDLDIEHSSAPDFIVHDSKGTQQVGWHLDVTHLRFVGGTGQPSFPETERAKFLDLRQFHKGAKMKASTAAAVTDLPGGDLSAGESEEKFDVSFDGQVVHPDRSIPLSARWTGGFQTLKALSGNLTIVLAGGAWVNVSTLAPTRNGASHFHHYYDLFDQLPGKQVTIEHPKRMDRIVRNVEVFDCVPPVPMP